MEIKLKCPSCGVRGIMGSTGTFEVLGRYNGYPAYLCSSCGAGLRITNAGRALITKRAKAERMPDHARDKMRDAVD